MRGEDAYDLACVMLCIYGTYEAIQHAVEVRKATAYDTALGITWSE